MLVTRGSSQLLRIEIGTNFCEKSLHAKHLKLTGMGLWDLKSEALSALNTARAGKLGSSQMKKKA
jgi:hypothetical protein